MDLMLTGISGFVGHHIFEHVMKQTDWTVLGLHRSGFAGDLGRLDEVLKGHPEWRDRLTLAHHDLRDTFSRRLPGIKRVWHVAASSHVDRSITSPKDFVLDNVLGTTNLLNYCRDEVDQFIYFSTDEVYGNAPDGVEHTEDFPHRPRNPYAASKAAAEDICYSYHITYGLPLIITNTMNIIGERQHTEKFLPLVMRSILRGETVKIHAHPDRKRAGQRHYLHARNATDALLFVSEHGKVGERYNIVGQEEIDNLEFARRVHKHMEQTLKFPPMLRYELVDFHSSRPGHDLRYALDGSKLNDMGYRFPLSFDLSLKNTVRWTMENRDRWL